MAIKSLNSVAGFSVGETPANIILANGDVTTTNITTTGVSNLNAIGNVKITGGSSGQAITTDGAGNLSFTTIASGTLSNGTSNIQVLNSGNITFSVAGTANVGKFTSTGLNVNGYITTSGNITGGNADLGNAATANFFIGSGNNLSNIQGANVSGAVSFATTANAVAGANVSGEVSFAATANAVAGANVTGTVANANNSAYAGNVTIAGQANITSLGTLTSLNVNAAVNAVSFSSNVAAGTAPLTVLSNTVVANLNADLLDGYNSAVANTANTVAVRNSDGNLSANYFVGNGAFLTGIDTSLISNGNSNVAVAANGNVTISVAGNTGIATFTGTGANINGTANVTGNLSAGNVSANIANLTTANVTGNVIAGGVLTNNLYYANGTPWDLQEAAGANTQIQYNNGTNNNFGASANFTFNDATNVLTVTGNIAASNANLGNAATANFFIGSGNNLSNIQGANVTGAVASATSATTAGTVTTAAQPNITSVGTLTSLTSGNIFAPAIVQNASTYDTRIELNSGAGIIQANTNGNVTQFLPGGSMRLPSAGASDIISGTFDGSKLTLGTSQVDLVQNRGGNVTVQLGTGGTIANTWTFAQNGSFTSPGTVNGTQLVSNIATGTAPLVVTSTTQVANLNAATAGTAGSATTAGTVTTNAQPNITSVGTLTSLAVTGNLSAGNANLGNLATANFFAGTLTTAAQPNVTSVGNLTSLDVTGNIVTSANLVTDLIVGRTTSISISATGANSNVFLKPTGTGTVDVWGARISNVATPTASTDAATKQYVDDVAQGLHTHDSCNAATQTTLATISGGTVTYNNGTSGVGATLTTTGSYTTIDGVTLSNGMRILVKDEVTAANNGIYVRTSATVLTRADDFDTPTEMAGGDFTFVTAGTLYDNTGWVMPDPVTTVGTTAVVWVQFSGAGTYTAGTGLTLNGNQFNISNTAVTAGAYGNGDYNATFTVNAQGQLTAAANVAITANAANLTGTTLAATIVNSSLTSVGTLANLSVTGNISGGNANLGNLATANFFAGTLTTAAQPNITSVGTLTGLDVNGNITAANITANTGVFTGNGAGLTNIAGANVTGTVANATFATSSGTAGTVTTAAQPNITSVGTLTSLAVTGNVTTGNISGTNGNLTTANVSGNIILGNATVTTQITWSSLTTTSTAANQTIASISTTGVTGVEYLIKAIDSTGSKYSVASVIAVTDGTNVDYSTYGTVQLGGYTGSLAVNIVGGQVRLQVTPSSSNSTVWTTQYRLI